MRNHEEGRRVLVGLIREYNKGEIEDQKFRSLVYGLTLLLSYFKFESDLDLETRIEALEEAIR